MATHLMLPHINMIHVDQRYDVPILFIVQGDTDFVELQLNIEVWCVVVEFVIHDHLESHQLGGWKRSCHLPGPHPTRASG
jgi:hypothetical protein